MCLALAGCKSAQDRAIDQAKQTATATGQPQEVISVDSKGDTTVVMVQPPTTPGTAPALTTAVTPAGATSVQGLPDWSNGTHPAQGGTATYSAPGVMTTTVAGKTPKPATPGTPGAAPAVVGNDAAAAPQSTVRFVPTDVTIPAGTGLAIRINQRIDVKHAAVGEPFSGELAETISRDGKLILPRGTRFNGVVDAAHRRGHFKGRSILSLRLTSMQYDGKEYPIATANNVSSKKGKGKRSAAFIGGGAGLGMLVGGLATGGVGLVVGGLAGGGLGTLLAGTTGNRDIVIPAESLVRFRLEDDLTVQPAR